MRVKGLIRYVMIPASSVFIGREIFDLIGYEVALVDGRSMQPTLNPHLDNIFTARSAESCRKRMFNWSHWTFSDWVLISHHDKFNIKVGDVVTIYNPIELTDRDIKRVRATEHQMITTRSYKKQTVVVPEGHIWVEGDNRVYSKDSNSYGPIPAALVFGKAIAIVWPPSRWQTLKSESTRFSAHKFLNAAEKDDPVD